MARNGLSLFAMYAHKKAQFEHKRPNNKDVYNNIIKSLWLKNPINKPYLINIDNFLGKVNGYTHVIVGMDIAHKKKTDRSKSM